MVFEKVEAPRWLHPFIIGSNGQNVCKVTEEIQKSMFSLETKRKQLISLEGLPAELAQAKEAF